MVQSKGGEPFNTNTINVAQERDFYRKKPVNDDEMKFWKFIYADKVKEVRKALDDYTDNYLMPFKEEKN